MGNQSTKTNEYGYNFQTTAEDVLSGKDLSNKVFMITGGSSGIGKEITRNLYNHNATVIIASVVLDEMRSAFKEIRKQGSRSCKGELHLLYLDLANQRKIERTIEAFENSELPKRIDTLICNAGVMMCPMRITRDGFEFHMAVNHFGHFAFVNKMLPYINPETGRIVVTSSKGHNEFGAKIHFEDMEFRNAKALVPGKRILRAKAYGQSKLAQLLFSRELNRRLQENGSKITSYSLHPGVVHTKLQKQDFWTSLYYDIGNKFLPYFKKLEQGAATSVFLATDERVLNDSGKYFEDCGVSKNVSQEGLDDDVAKKLFDLSERRTGVKFPFYREEETEGEEMN